MTQPIPENNQEYFKQLNIVYLALILGQIMIFVLLYFFVGPSSTKGSDSGIFNIVLPMFALTSFGLSFLIYNRKKAAGAQLESLQHKKEDYRIANILRWALVEGINLFAIITYFFIHASPVNLIILAVGLGLFLMYRPTVDGFKQDYNISDREYNT